MTNTVEEVTEIPLVYPLVSITLKTTNIVNGRPIMSECEEIIDVRKTHFGCPANKLLKEFKGYVKKVIESAQSPQGNDALQNILDTHQRPASRDPADLPLTPDAPAMADQGTEPSDLPGPLPESASL